MSPVARYAVAVLLGLTLGLGSAVAVTGGLMGGGAVTAGRWSTDLTVGAPAATPWVRARIARVGLLALNREETLYFDRATDEDGRALDARCRYRVEGGPLPARWWSVTLYGADQMLPRNDDGAASVDATRLAAAGAWEATVAAAPPSAGGAKASFSAEPPRFSNRPSISPAGFHASMPWVQTMSVLGRSSEFTAFTLSSANVTGPMRSPSRL